MGNGKRKKEGLVSQTEVWRELWLKGGDGSELVVSLMMNTKTKLKCESSSV